MGALPASPVAVPDFTRREFLAAFAGAFADALASSPGGSTGALLERCDACGGPAPDASPLPYCLWCDAVIHRSCARRIACDHSSDSDWRQMFHEAGPEEIEHLHGHELIVAVIVQD